jgi:hypothetical protein
MSEKQITSVEQLQEQIGSILEQLNADPALALAAAANPLFALEELGFEISTDARPEIEDRIRFYPRIAARLRKLRRTIFKEVGHPFDLHSSNQIQTVLFEELKLDVPRKRARKKGKKKKARRALPDPSPLPAQMSWAEEKSDPLEVLRDTHPVMDSLLEYRRLDASQPRLAPRELYEEIRAGKRRLPIRSVRGRLRAKAD